MMGKKSNAPLNLPYVFGRQSGKVFYGSFVRRSDCLYERPCPSQHQYGRRSATRNYCYPLSRYDVDTCTSRCPFIQYLGSPTMSDPQYDIHDVTKSATDLMFFGCTSSGTYLPDSVLQIKFSAVIANYVNAVIRDVSEGVISAWEGVQELKDGYSNSGSTVTGLMRLRGLVEARSCERLRAVNSSAQQGRAYSRLKVCLDRSTPNS